ncbi:transcription elongation factor GreAB [Ramlibacter sp. G-1-2-2]|uniref:Transcription elongation factor GreAB n=1 Tax=Ramlibacter agri TaxID=2728837 RepID=A0A848H734_9BURK|nr:transcription elongation factor GreAB [Ramlibacter agri]
METTLQRERTLTHIDHVRLARLPCSEAMQEMLAGSELVAPRAVPPTLVTMRTQVLLRDLAWDAPPYELTLCYPEDADPSRGLISVLSPVGSALLGLQVGDTARWHGPQGRWGEARILAVLFQPEAHGDFGA